MGLYAVKPRFRASLRRPERLLIARGVSADDLTVAGLGCALGAAAVVTASGVSPLWLLAVTPLVILRLACNALDGMVATTTGAARPLGQIFNEFSDRVADAAVLLAITVRTGSTLLGALTLTTVLLSSYLGTAAAAAGGTRQYVGVMGKADRMVLLAVVVPLAVFVGPALLRWYLVAVAFGATITLAQRGRAIRRELRGASYP
jgi:CDP-diacylglycerol--glycerol-3-phosphate 3-phosphatidyltransferase